MYSQASVKAFSSGIEKMNSCAVADDIILCTLSKYLCALAVRCVHSSLIYYSSGGSQTSRRDKVPSVWESHALPATVRRAHRKGYGYKLTYGKATPGVWRRIIPESHIHRENLTLLPSGGRRQRGGGVREDGAQNKGEETDKTTRQSLLLVPTSEHGTGPNLIPRFWL